MSRYTRNDEDTVHQPPLKHLVRLVRDLHDLCRIHGHGSVDGYGPRTRLGHGHSGQWSGEAYNLLHTSSHVRGHDHGHGHDRGRVPKSAEVAR